MKHWFIGVLALITAAPSLAAPVHLECTRPDKAGQPQVWKITLDEEQSLAVVTYPNGGSIKRVPASFTADAVTFQPFTVSRVDLTFGNYAGKGQCVKVDTANRAF